MRLQTQSHPVTSSITSSAYSFAVLILLFVIPISSAAATTNFSNNDAILTTHSKSSEIKASDREIIIIEVAEVIGPADSFWVQNILKNENTGDQKLIVIKRTSNKGLPSSILQIKEAIQKHQTSVITYPLTTSIPSPLTINSKERSNTKQPIPDDIFVYLNTLTPTASSNSIAPPASDKETLNKITIKNITYADKDWLYFLFEIMTKPNTAYSILLLGILGIVYEFYNPGKIIPIATGTSAVLFAVYTFQYLPVNYVSLTIMLLGILLMLLEVHAPHYGVLGLIGLSAFIAGSVRLIDTDIVSYQISLSLIAGFGLFSALALIFIEAIIEKTKKWISSNGELTLIGRGAEAVNDFNYDGPVMVQGEYWEAHYEGAMRKGERRRIKAINGLVLVLD